MLHVRKFIPTSYIKRIIPTSTNIQTCHKSSCENNNEHKIFTGKEFKVKFDISKIYKIVDDKNELNNDKLSFNPGNKHYKKNLYFTSFCNIDEFMDDNTQIKEMSHVNKKKIPYTKFQIFRYFLAGVVLIFVFIDNIFTVMFTFCIIAILI